MSASIARSGAKCSMDEVASIEESGRSDSSKGPIGADSASSAHSAPDTTWNREIR